MILKAVSRFFMISLNFLFEKYVSSCVREIFMKTVSFKWKPLICMYSTWFKKYKLYMITMLECRHLYILEKSMINENYKFSWDFYPHLSKSLKYLNVSLYHNYGVKKSNLWVLNFCLQLVSYFYHVWIRLKNINSKFREKKWKKNGKKWKKKSQITLILVHTFEKFSL